MTITEKRKLIEIERNESIKFLDEIKKEIDTLNIELSDEEYNKIYDSCTGKLLEISMKMRNAKEIYES
jgi:hypothetical protein